MNKKPVIACLCSILFFSSAAFLSPDPLKDKITRALDKWLSGYPQEKVYLQFDKDYYAAGETIWFAGYITDGRLPTAYSTNLYVELINKKGKVLQRNMLPIIKGTASGDFELSQDFPPGDYRIRAYTAWMLNLDPAFLFEKDIRIFDPATPPAAQNTPVADTGSFSVQFFPEGGDLVEGVASTVAFKAIGTDGLPVTVTGSVTDGRGDTVAAIRCLHDGMGSFELSPQKSVRYQAAVRAGNGTAQVFPLPAAKDTGVVLHIIRATHQKLFFQVRPSPGLSSGYNELKLVAQFEGHLVYYNTIDFGKGLSGGMIPTGKLPSGILQLTVFRSDGLPLAERLVFIRNDDLLKLRLKPEHLDLAARQKNTFRITVPDSLRDGRFSVAVTDADQVSRSPYADNIVSDLLLTSDIKGNVYRPAWYFANGDDSTLQALDLVMMTNGWRRFDWKDLLQGQYPPIQYPPETDHIGFHGKAFERKAALQHGKMQMFVKAPLDSLTYFINTPVNKDGYFEVQGLAFHDTASLYYKGVDTLRKGREVQVNMAAPFTSQLSFVLLGHPIRPYYVTSPRQLADYLQLSQERNHIYDLISRRSILLKQVDVRAKRITNEEKTEDRYTSALFKSDNGYTFDLTGKPQPYTSIFEFLQGRVAGLRIAGNPYANPMVSWRGGTPGFFLDEMPVDAATIATVPVSDIALVKVFRPPFMGGLNGANGAIAIYTKRGGDNDDDMLQRGFDKMRLPGYTWTRQFYSPDYSVKKEINELPDKRVTLYWNPSVKTDSTHTATFSFYNTDITHRIRIVVEGMNSRGKVGRIEKVFPE